MIANERAENLLCVLRSKNRFIKLFTLVTSNALRLTDMLQIPFLFL